MAVLRTFFSTAKLQLQKTKNKTNGLGMGKTLFQSLELFPKPASNPWETAQNCLPMFGKPGNLPTSRDWPSGGNGTGHRGILPSLEKSPPTSGLSPKQASNLWSIFPNPPPRSGETPKHASNVWKLSRNMLPILGKSPKLTSNVWKTRGLKIKPRLALPGA